MLVDYGQGSSRAQRRVDDTRRLSPHAESVHEVFAHVPSCSSRGRPPYTQIPHAASGRAMLCSPRLRVFVPYDEGVSQVLIPEHRGCPNSERVRKSPSTRSCMRSVLAKHSVRRTSRLIRVRRLLCLLSIFCVFSLPT